MESLMKLECYPVDPDAPELVPGRPDRDWMDAFAHRHPYKCLPLVMANTTGWELQCPFSFTAHWNGGAEAADIRIWSDPPDPKVDRMVTSHFTRGVLTFHTGYLFRTEPGWAVWATGAPNHVKDGIQPLTGLVETDWLPFPFTMNWLFTRPCQVKFKKGEPFCFITLVEHKKLEAVQPTLRTLDADPELRGQYEAWHQQRTNFNAKLSAGDPETAKQQWQRFYFKGEMPKELGAAPTGHVNRRRLKPLKKG
jgi:hypothetical protein